MTEDGDSDVAEAVIALEGTPMDPEDFGLPTLEEINDSGGQDE